MDRAPARTIERRTTGCNSTRQVSMPMRFSCMCCNGTIWLSADVRRRKEVESPLTSKPTYRLNLGSGVALRRRVAAISEPSGSFQVRRVLSLRLRKSESCHRAAGCGKVVGVVEQRAACAASRSTEAKTRSSHRNSRQTILSSVSLRVVVNCFCQTLSPGPARRCLSRTDPGLAWPWMLARHSVQREAA